MSRKRETDLLFGFIPVRNRVAEAQNRRADARERGESMYKDSSGDWDFTDGWEQLN